MGPDDTSLSRARCVVPVAAAAVLGLTSSAHAGHSYTEVYNPLYLAGVALVLAVTFVLIAAVVRRAATVGWPTYDLLRLHPVRAIAGSAIGAGLRVAAVLGLGLVAVAGLVGSRIEAWNIAPSLVWVVAWVVIPALQLLAGDVWTVLNPWRAVSTWVGAARPPRFAYPTRLGAWPAVGVFAALVWLKEATPWAGDPRLLGTLVVVYSAVTWSGMVLFGARAWLERAEGFTGFYRLIAATAPLELHEGGGGGRQLLLRPYAVGLLARPAGGHDTTLFVLVMLAGGLFGGLLETRAWESFRVGLGLAAQRSLGQDTVVFAGFLGLTVGVYWLSCALARLIAGPALGVGDVALGFASSLIPLAAGFHLTHGLDHTLESLQRLMRLSSDPLGFGWDLFGTRTMSLLKPNAWFVWYVQLAVIIAVHVAGIWVAHVQALALYRDRGAAVRSQFAMVGVMMLFTISGLWILSKIPMMM